jgi:ribose 5-phosphate isomerase B
VRIALASDHAAVSLKRSLSQWLVAAGHEVLDLGTDGTESVDYPDYGFALAAALAEGRAERGIALCGSGIGIAIAANRNPACRCAQVSEPLSARLARTHNDANAIAIGARLVGEEMAKACVEAFLDADFLGGRHQHRVDMLSAATIEPAAPAGETA